MTGLCVLNLVCFSLFCRPCPALSAAAAAAAAPFRWIQIVKICVCAREGETEHIAAHFDRRRQDSYVRVVTSPLPTQHNTTIIPLASSHACFNCPRCGNQVWYRRSKRQRERGRKKAQSPAKQTNNRKD